MEVGVLKIVVPLLIPSFMFTEFIAILVNWQLKRGRFFQDVKYFFFFEMFEPTASPKDMVSCPRSVDSIASLRLKFIPPAPIGVVVCTENKKPISTPPPLHPFFDRHGRIGQEHLHQADAHHPWGGIPGRGETKSDQAGLPEHLPGHVHSHPGHGDSQNLL